jgi:hypothetical protein
MKKIILGTFIIVLVACGQADTTKPVIVTTKDSTTVMPTYGAVPISFYNAKLKAFQQYLTTLAAADLVSNTKAITQFKVLFMREPAALCDTAYTLFQTFNNKLVEQLNSKLTGDYSSALDTIMSVNEDDTPVTLSVPLQQLKETITNNGFMLQMEEGIAFIITDRSFTAKQLYSMLSPVMVTYLTQLQKEDIEVFESDASLIIEPKAFVDRVIWYENFLAKNPQFIYATISSDNLGSYMSVLIGNISLDNSPFYNDDGKTLTDYFEQALGYLNKQYPQSQANKIAHPIYQAIKAGQIDKVKQLQAAYKKTVAM